MKLNNITYCFILWAFVEAITVFIAVLRRRKEASLMGLIEVYYKRLLYFAEKGLTPEELLQEMLFSFANNRMLHKLLFTALRKGDIYRSFEYIEKVLPCEAIASAHHCLLLQEKIQKQEFELWKSNQQMLKELSTKNRVKTIVEKYIVLLVNLALYLRLNNSFSQSICIIVNTIGVILLIVLELEWMVVDGKKRERKLARLLGQKNKTQIFQLVAGLGLILNISMIAVQFLEQAV